MGESDWVGGWVGWGGSPATPQGRTRYSWPAPLYRLRPDWPAHAATDPPPTAAAAAAAAPGVGSPVAARPVRPIWEPVRPAAGPPRAMPSYTECFQGF